MNPTTTLCCLSTLLAVMAVPGHAADNNKTWTDPEAARQEDPDYLVQGEYGLNQPGAAWGVQVVALGDGKFDAYLLEGGLPGLGWTRGKTRTPLTGGRTDGGVALSSADGRISATIRDGRIRLGREGEKEVTLPRIERSSPTSGAKPPKDAVVLFDGSSAEQWQNGTVEQGMLAAANCTSKQGFGDYFLHIEFRTPYKPHARGQDRGNSGVYYAGRWETQVLDSFGLNGEQNECGGVYSIAQPRLNMCFPPLTWQTYDVDFTAAKFAADGTRTAWPRITVKLNGVLIHEDLELGKDNTTASPLGGPLKNEPGPIFLQNHGNPVHFRNIWLLPGK